jgi:hypothetical protein
VLVKSPDQLLCIYTGQYDVLRESLHANFEPWSQAYTVFSFGWQLELYATFTEKHPDVNCCLWSFDMLKPWWVRQLKNWNTCCCRYYQELVELRHSLNVMKTIKQGIHSHCDCECILVCSNADSSERPRNCNISNRTYE